MTYQSITLHVPETVYRRAQHAAKALQRPLEEIMLETLSVALPSLDDVPAELTNELARMSGLSSEALWEAARGFMPAKEQTRLRTLSSAQHKRALKPSELQTLNELRKEYGRFTLRKAQAYALLRQRGLYSPAAV